MKKIFISIAITIGIVFSAIPSYAVILDYDSIAVYFKNPTIIKKDQFYVPLFESSSYMDFKASHDKNTNTYTIVKDKKTLKLKPQSKDAVFNAQKVKLPNEAITVNNVLYVPLSIFDKLYNNKFVYNFTFDTIEMRENRPLPSDVLRKGDHLYNAVMEDRTVPFTRPMIYKMLTESGTSDKDAKAALNIPEKNWSNIAYKRMFELYDVKNMTLKQLEDYLVNNDKFTRAEAQYAVSRFPGAFLDKNTNVANMRLLTAYNLAAKTNHNYKASKKEIDDVLKSAGYPADIRTKAINMLSPNYKMNIFFRSRGIQKTYNSTEETKNTLKTIGFTPDEIEFAINNLFI